MIDTHCHLTDERLGEHLDDVLARAASAGVMRFITVGTDLEDSARCTELCRQHGNVRCTVGVHPTSAGEGAFSGRRLEELIRKPGVVAVGEIGLDYFWCKEMELRRMQRRIFVEQLQIAQATALPVVIHCREAVEDCLAVLRDFPQIRAVFHCFTGTMAEAEKILAARYWLGFTGAVTFKKNEELREVTRRVTSERLLLETDAPYMTPEPMRKQKINEPAMLVHTAKMVAMLRGLEMRDLEQITDENAARFFGWDVNGQDLR